VEMQDIKGESNIYLIRNPIHDYTQHFHYTHLVCHFWRKKM